jgi:diacylglycerol kinase (ATP)
MAMIPLGTGNDLSRMFGWGKHFHKSQLTQSHIQKIHTATPEILDLWHLTVTMPSSGITDRVRKWLPPGLHLESKMHADNGDNEDNSNDASEKKGETEQRDDGENNVEIYTGHICNYMSIGMTARGAMLFHQERERHPERFTGSLKNKMIF